MSVTFYTTNHFWHHYHKKKAETRTGFGLFEYIAGHIAPLLVTDYSPSAKRL
jgi:hypothetical protein